METTNVKVKLFKYHKLLLPYIVFLPLRLPHEAEINYPTEMETQKRLGNLRSP